MTKRHARELEQEPPGIRQQEREYECVSCFPHDEPIQRRCKYTEEQNHGDRYRRSISEIEVAHECLIHIDGHGLRASSGSTPGHDIHEIENRKRLNRTKYQS